MMSKSIAGWKRRMGALAVTSVLVGATLTGCSTGTPQSAGDEASMKIAYLGSASRDHAELMLIESMRAEVESAGYELVELKSEWDPSIQTQQVDTVISQNVDAVVMLPADGTTACSLVKRLQDNDIPVVDVLFSIPDCEVDYIAVRDDYEVGVTVAKAAQESVPSGNFVITQGDQANTSAYVTMNGQIDTLQSSIDSGEISLVSKNFNAGWSPSDAQSTTEQVLTANSNDVQAIIAGNDAMGLGALQAVKSQGLEGSIWIAGGDADPGALQEILAGNYNYSLWTDYPAQGFNAAQAAVALAQGNDMPDGTISIQNGKVEVPGIMTNAVGVTKDNLAEWVCEYKYYSPEEIFVGKYESLKPDC